MCSRSKCRGQVIIAFVMFAPSVLHSHQSKLYLSGTVTSLSGANAPGNGVFTVGNPFRYSFTMVETLGPVGPGVTRQVNAITGFEGVVGTYSFAGGSGDVFLRNDSPSPPIFGGAPYDQLTVAHQSLIVNQAALGLSRDDFTFTSGSVAGFPLHSVIVSIQTDNTSLLQDLDFDEAALQALVSNRGLATFNLGFMATAFGSFNVYVSATITEGRVVLFDSNFE